MKISLIIFCFFIAFYNCQVFTSFDGLWTDNVEAGGYGGNFSICTQGSVAYGMESEFAISYGVLSEDGLTWSGNFYEVFPQPDYNCAYGTFSYTLTENGTRIVGMYGCENRRLYFNYFAKRINADTQTSMECGQVMSLTEQQKSLNGRWISTLNGEAAKLDFCIDGNKFSASYDTNSQLPEGYDEGMVFNTKVAAGASYLANIKGALPGGSLYFLTPSGDLARIYWNGQNLFPNIYQINDPASHGYNIYRFTAGTVSSNCNRYASLANQPADFEDYTQVEESNFEAYDRQYPVFYPNATSYYNQNGAGHIVASLFSIIAFILLVA